MLVTKERVVYLENRTRNLAGLMDLYESNYIRLRKLIPDLAALSGPCLSVVPKGLQLHLRILERCKYTTTINLTYFFSEHGICFPAPDVKARIYHDAQLAEVISCGRRKGRRAAEYDRMRHQYPLLRKWEINRFLQKWLGYLLHQRHSFTPESVIQLLPVPEPVAIDCHDARELVHLK
ncbi:MAG: DUF1249 domain-containing protein [Gammaproteobacteria bacterium]